MLRNRYNMLRIFTSVVVIFLLSIAGCSNSDNPVDSGNQTAKIEGRVTGGSGFYKEGSLQKSDAMQDVQGAVVTVSRIKADGSLEVVSKASVETDVNGHFTVETNANNESNLLVEAVKGSSKWRAVVSAKTNSSSTITCPPVDDESTEEANVYIRIKARGKASSVNYADVKTYINADVAAQIKSNVITEDQAAASIEAEAEARAKAYSESSINVTSAQAQTIADAKTNAEVQLESRLYSSGNSDTEVENAQYAYLDAVINAYVQAGLSSDTYAKVITMSSQAMVNTSASLNSNARFAIEKSAAKIKAYITAKATEKQFQDAGADQSRMNAVVNAGVALRASIKGSQNSSDIDNAFVAFHSGIKTQLTAMMSTNATVINTVDSTINSSAGARAVLNLALSTAVTADAVVNAYAAFYSSVKTLVEGSLSSASSAEVKAATSTMILVNAY